MIPQQRRVMVIAATITPRRDFCLLAPTLRRRTIHHAISGVDGPPTLETMDTSLSASITLSHHDPGVVSPSLSRQDNTS